MFYNDFLPSKDNEESLSEATQEFEYVEPNASFTGSTAL